MMPSVWPRGRKKKREKQERERGRHLARRRCELIARSHVDSFTALYSACRRCKMNREKEMAAAVQERKRTTAPEWKGATMRELQGFAPVAGSKAASVGGAAARQPDSSSTAASFGGGMPFQWLDSSMARTAAAVGKSPRASIPPSIDRRQTSISGFSLPEVSTNYGFSDASHNQKGTWLDAAGGGNPMTTSFVRPQASDPQTWDSNPHPPGGYLNLFNNQPQVSHNCHFVSGASHNVPFKASNPICSAGFSPPLMDQDTINVDSEDDVVRTDKRILWTQKEDVRLMSAWLLNSTDPTIGADRRNEQYWGDVAGTYSNTTPRNRWRNPKQAKDWWHKINKWTDLFHAWLKACRTFTSGHFDQMWIDKAHHFYEDDNKDLKLGPFVFMDVCNLVRNEPKWITYNKGLQQARKRKAANKESEEHIHPIDVDSAECPKPIRQKQAKKAAYDAKAKSKLSNNDIEELRTYEKIKSEGHANRLKVLEVQKLLSSEKLESAKLAHLAAKEQKEAAKDQKEAKKYEAEARMFEMYNCLLSQDRTLMSDEEKADHAAIIKCLKKKLFAEFN